MKFKRLKDGAVFQLVGSYHSMAEYEKVDAAYYRLVGIGTLLPIDQCLKGDDEQVVSQDVPRSKR